MAEQQYVEDVDEFLDGLKLPETEVPICGRGDLQARFEDLERQLDVARSQPADDSLASKETEAQRIAKEIQALQVEMQQHVRVFLLRALPRKAWSDLVKEHPARKQDAPADFNRDSFPVAALAACAVKPSLTEEKAGRVVDRITQGQWSLLWNAILELNGGSGEVPFSAAASVILSSTSGS
ncbi:hypothetical protein [Nonomuraea sediminis]|uniref:hypothetical protein n=1 Tax=Nonomuraea sediminis TaxID=2835864 RepID=UPI001BDD6EF6|nr:hypothetical protein [Nonomuraea sediminis]